MAFLPTVYLSGKVLPYAAETREIRVLVFSLEKLGRPWAFPRNPETSAVAKIESSERTRGSREWRREGGSMQIMSMS
jgi:hypothetical protein